MNGTWAEMIDGFLKTFSNMFHTMLQMFAGRLLFAALALSLLTACIMLARKKCSPALRSWLWALLIVCLALPFEHSAVFFAQRGAGVPLFITDGPAAAIVQTVLAYLWFGGFVFFSMRARLRRKRTMRRIKTGKLAGCAAYFFRFRSRVYLPPDFEKAYTPAQKEMLLAHERQHIKQHDPLLFRALEVLQCVFWFCPPVYKAVPLIRHDRELLCDARVTRKYSKREYGLLLLREAEKASPGHALAGIASEQGGIFERVRACAIPFSGGGRVAVLALCAAVCVCVVGFIGVVHPICNGADVALVSADTGGSLLQIEGAERFVSFNEDGVFVDEDGLRGYVGAAGYPPGQKLRVTIFFTRPGLTTALQWEQSALFPTTNLRRNRLNCRTTVWWHCIGACEHSFFIRLEAN